MTTRDLHASQRGTAFFASLVGLSVDLHNLNASVQRRCGISLVQWLVLSKIVDQPGMSAGTLSETVGVHPSTLTPTLGRLEATGLIYIQERPTDLRRKMLLVSQRGFRKNQECVLLLTTLANEIKSTSFDLLDIDQVREVTGSLASSISGRLDHS